MPSPAETACPAVDFVVLQAAGLSVPLLLLDESARHVQRALILPLERAREALCTIVATEDDSEILPEAFGLPKGRAAPTVLYIPLSDEAH